MQKSVKQNRALLGKKKSLKELRKEHGSFSKGELKFKNPTEKELADYRIRLNKQLKVDRQKRYLTISICLAIGILCWYLLFQKTY